MFRAPRTSSDPDDPVFLWDRRLTAGEVRAILAADDDPRRRQLLALILREARPDDVWSWVTPQVVADELDLLAPMLGRKKQFWLWLVAGWRRLGLLR